MDDPEEGPHLRNICINPLMTKLYDLKTQSVPRSKLSLPRL
jgi:hypothetical protein